MIRIPRQTAALWSVVFLLFSLFFPFAAAAQEVTLPLSLYDELWARAHPEPEPTAPPAVPAALEEARLEIVAGKAGARVAQDLVVVLTGGAQGEEWLSLPLPEIGSFVAADFGDLEGRLGDGELLVRGGAASGRHAVRLESALEMERDEGATRPTWRLALKAPEAALVRGRLVVGPGLGEIEEIDAVGAAVLVGDGRFLAAPGKDFGLVLRGPATVPERARLPLRFEALSANLYEVARHRHRLFSQVALEVLQGRLEEARLGLPPGFEVIGVEGSEIAGWDAPNGELVVTPLTAVDGVLRFAVELSGEATEEFASPVLEVAGAARQFLASRVTTERDGLLSLLEAGDARQPGPGELERLPPGFRAGEGWTLVVPRGAAAPRWQVLWPEGTEVLAAQVDRLLVDAAVGTAGRAAYQLWAEVRSSGAPRLAVDLPGAELVAAHRDGAAIDPGRDAEGWVVPLAAPVEGAANDGRQVIHLQFVLPLALPARGELALPMPTLSAPASRIETRLLLPGGDRQYRLAEDSRRARVSPPPVLASRSEAPLVSQQLGFAAGLESAAPRAGFLPHVPGFELFEARWNALSAHPGPLVVDVDPQRQREEWF